MNRPALERRDAAESWFHAAVRYAGENGLDLDAVETRFVDAVKLGASAETAARYAVDTSVTRSLLSEQVRD